MLSWKQTFLTFSLCMLLPSLTGCLTLCVVLTFQGQPFGAFLLCPGCIGTSPPPSFPRNEADKAQGVTSLDTQTGTSNYQQKVGKDREGNRLGVP